MEASVRLYALNYDEAKTYLWATVFVACNLVLPQVFHLIPQGGVIFAPLSLIILAGAYKFGWKVGLLAALASPLVNHLLTGLPAMATMTMMMVKLSILALVAGLAAQRFKTVTLPILVGVVLTSLALGALVEFILTGAIASVIADVTIGWLGLILQVVGTWLILNIHRFMGKGAMLIAAAMLLSLGACAQKSEKAQEAKNAGPSFDEVLTSRRSVRSYNATKKITEQEVRELLTATQEAPSWANQEPTKYYVAMSAEKLAAVQDLVGGNKDRIKEAPVLIVSTFERGKSGFFQGNATNEVGDGWGAYDNGLSNCYLILKARAMGFDTLIMGMRDADGLRNVFDIPESETIMAVISLGYRAGEPNRPVRRPLDDIVKFY